MMFELSRDPVPSPDDFDNHGEYGHEHPPTGSLRDKSQKTFHKLVPTQIEAINVGKRKKDDDDDEGATTPTAENVATAHTSASKYCSYCERRVMTQVEHQPTALSFIFSFLSFMTCGWIAFCVIPFVWPLLQTAVHRCPLCGDVLEKKSRMSCLKIRDEVITLRLGSCAVVLSRKYVIGCSMMLSLIALGLGIRWYLKVFGLPDLPKGPPIDRSWQTFIQDCGNKGYLGNPVKAEKLFEKFYLDKTVTWDGRVHHIQEGIFSKNFMYLAMEPSQRDSGSDLRDIALIFGKTLQSKAAEIDPGDLLHFEATLLELGKRGRPHLGVLWDFNITAKNDELPPLHDEKNRFVILRDHIGRPPVDLPRVAKRLIDLQKAIHAKQNTTETFVMMLPFAGGLAPLQIIRQLPTDSVQSGVEQKEIDAPKMMLDVVPSENDGTLTMTN